MEYINFISFFYSLIIIITEQIFDILSLILSQVKNKINFNYDFNINNIDKLNLLNFELDRYNLNDLLVCVINLDRRKDRMLLMDYKLRELNINYKRITGIDGIEYKNDYESYLKLFTQEEINQKLIINSVSAYGLIKTYQERISPLANIFNTHVCIFEDDCIFHHDFNNLFFKYSNIIKENDVIYLGCQQTLWKTSMHKSIEQNGYYNINTNKYYIPYGHYGIIFSISFLKILNQELNEKINTKQIRNIDIFVPSLITKYNFNCIILYPGLVVPQVYESDNMGHRDIRDMAYQRKWDLNLYKYVDLSSEFTNIYNQIYSNNISLRSISHTINNDLSNIQISKLIENKNNSFVFIITSYNNEKWVFKNLSSILNQDYVFWRIIYIDDNSSDQTYDLVSKFMKDNNLDQKMILIKNEERYGQAYGRYIAYNQCYDDEVCCLLDGDDWLTEDKNILVKLNYLYSKYDLNITYGQFYYYEGDNLKLTLSGTYSYTHHEIITNNYRNKWITQHLRTVRASLLKTIEKEYLIFKDKWITCCTDAAEMYWCLERSNGKHMNSGFPTVIYNKINSINHKNSFYNQKYYPEEKEYRDQVWNYIINYKK